MQVEVTPEMVRAEQIAGIRRMADWLEAHPDVPIQYAPSMSIYVDMKEAREIRAASFGGWVKGDTGYAFTYRQTFTGPAIPDWKACTYTVNVSKSEDTCRKVQTGTRHIEATEARDEPVYEWVCGPDADNDE